MNLRWVTRYVESADGYTHVLVEGTNYYEAVPVKSRHEVKVLQYFSKYQKNPKLSIWIDVPTEEEEKK